MRLSGDERVHSGGPRKRKKQFRCRASVLITGFTLVIIVFYSSVLVDTLQSNNTLNLLRTANFMPGTFPPSSSNKKILVVLEDPVLPSTVVEDHIFIKNENAVIFITVQSPLTSLSVVKMNV